MRDEFKVHKLNVDGMEAARIIADAFSVLLTHIEQLVPAGRECAIVVTKLQEACFFAKRAIATKPENQLP
jgi:hypothetical protein